MQPCHSSVCMDLPTLHACHLPPAPPLPLLRAEVVAYLRKVRQIVPQDLKFVIEDATEGDPRKVGIMW